MKAMSKDIAFLFYLLKKPAENCHRLLFTNFKIFQRVEIKKNLRILLYFN
ncbi:hypothetical protein BN1013_01740 [Candidatus Rubidus massiliensis]|nr:hypothetical protein BN1013_01740 [Candidatus Rubidus massiliensis]